MAVSSRLECLDGYRGFLAITVIIQHLVAYIHTDKTKGDWLIFYPMGHTIGVQGFFILSAFLLTYRLMVDFERAESLVTCLIRLIQYTVRRFFRIYLVFIVYWTLIHYGPQIFRGNYIGPSYNYANYSDGFILGSLGANHLWTIPIEIRYYFYIPFLSFIFAKTGKYWLPSLILYIIVLVDFMSGLKWILTLTTTLFNYSYWYHIYKYQIFFIGSFVGIAYGKLKTHCRIEKLFENRIRKLILDVLLIFIFYSKFKLFTGPNFKSVHSYSYLACLLALTCLLFVDNAHPIARLLNSFFLRKCGEYSFGMYLLHPVIIQAYRELHIEKNLSLVIYYYSELVVFVVIMTFAVACLWFHLLENVLMKLANSLCRKLEVFSSCICKL